MVIHANHSVLFVTNPKVSFNFFRDRRDFGQASTSIDIRYFDRAPVHLATLYYDGIIILYLNNVFE